MLSTKKEKEKAEKVVKRKRAPQPTVAASPGVQPCCLEMTHSGSAPEICEESCGLEAWVHPLQPTAFLRDIFRKRALCVRGGRSGGSAARIRRLCGESLGGLDVPALLEATASDKVFLWISARQPGPAVRSPALAPPPLKSVELDDAAAAATLHGTGGHSAYCRAPPGVEASLVRSLLRGTGLGLGCYNLAAPGAHDLARGEVRTPQLALPSPPKWRCPSRRRAPGRRWPLVHRTPPPPPVTGVLGGCTLT